MGQYDGLINAANKALKNTSMLLQGDGTPFNVMYKQYKIVQSLWFRVVEDASEANSKKLETLCIELETAVADCEEWIKNNSPTKKSEDSEEMEDVEDTNEEA